MRSTELQKPDVISLGLPPGTNLYGIFGVCRSGTTAVEKLLALTGMPAFHQPIKSALLRGITLNLSEHLGADNLPNNGVVIKETLGGYSLAASTFNPLYTFTQNAAPERIRTVFTLKEPFNNFLSWIRMTEADMAPPKEPLSTEELLGHYVLASQTTYDMLDESRRQGISTTVFDYESLRTQDGTAAARELLGQLGLDPAAYAPDLWASRPSVRDSSSGIIDVVARPPRALHDRLDASSAFQYFPPDESLLPAAMRDEVVDQLVQAGIYDAYNRAVAS